MMECMKTAQSFTRGECSDRSLVSLLSVMVVKHSNWLPGKVVDTPCLSIYKMHLDNTLNNML